jgi:hypothetical protein
MVFLVVREQTTAALIQTIRISDEERLLLEVDSEQAHLLSDSQREIAFAAG